MNKIRNEFYVPFTRKLIPIKNYGKVSLLLDDGWNGDIFSYSDAVTLQYGCFESYPFRQKNIIFVHQITWFRWNTWHWTSGVNVHNTNSNRYVSY
jgi:hypothetical protein